MVSTLRFAVLAAAIIVVVGISAWYLGNEPSVESTGLASRSSGTTPLTVSPIQGSPIASPPGTVAADQIAPVSEMVSQTVLATQFDVLLNRARRDPVFAYALARALNQCSQSDKQRSDAKRLMAINKIHAEQRLEVLEKRFAMCVGLDESQIAFQYELMAAAARAGIYEAQLDYRDVVGEAMRTGHAARNPNVMDEMRANFEAFTLAAARTGQPEALYRAFSMYDNGRLVMQNPVEAYRYLEMYRRVASNMDPLRARMIQEQLARLDAGMTEAQRRQARRN
jgi:hypothetical protein